MCGTQVSILGLLANERDMPLTQIQCPMGCHGHRENLCNRNRFSFGNNIFLALSDLTKQFRLHEKLSLGAT